MAVLGDQGFGKSALARELVRRLRVSGRNALQLDASEGADALLAALERFALPGGAGAGGNELERLARLLEGLRTKAGLLVFERVHTADDRARRFLGMLLPGLAAGEGKLLIVVTAGSRAALRGIAPVASRRKEYVLEPLNRRAIGELVAALLNVAEEDVPVGLVDEVEATAQGRPGMAVSLLRELVSERVLRQEGGRWHIA